MTNCLNYWYLWYIFFLYGFCLFWFSISSVLRLCIIEIHFVHLLYFVQFFVLFECVVLVCHPFHFVSFRSFIPCFLVSYVWCQFNIHTCDHDMKEKTLRTIGMMMLIMLLDYPEWNIGNHKVADIMFCLDMKWSDRERKKEDKILKKKQYWINSYAELTNVFTIVNLISIGFFWTNVDYQQLHQFLHMWLMASERRKKTKSQSNHQPCLNITHFRLHISEQSQNLNFLWIEK